MCSMRGVPRAASVWLSEPAQAAAPRFMIVPPWGGYACEPKPAEPPAMTHRTSALRPDDFRRILASRPCARTAHFVLHHAAKLSKHAGSDLSTPPSPTSSTAVDESPRLGLVLPKRLARHAVTRNLLKRQARAIFLARSPRCPGDWVIRLNRAFDRQQFSSASSAALHAAVGEEIRELLAAAKLPPRAA